MEKELESSERIEIKRRALDYFSSHLLSSPIGESVEPLVYCVDERRYPSSYFLYSVTCNGEEIYSMEEDRIRKEESRGYRDLAAEYLEGSYNCLKNKDFRLAADAAYNAAELCAKGLLLLKLDDLPSSHGGVVIKFSELFIKQGDVYRDIGRALNKTLALGNKSRYDRHARIGKEDAKEAQNLAEKMATLLDREFHP